jgi:hypothetical protein
VCQEYLPREIKRPGRETGISPASSAEVKEWVELRWGADKSLAFPISYLQHNQKIFFFGWVKEVRTTKL